MKLEDLLKDATPALSAEEATRLQYSDNGKRQRPLHERRHRNKLETILRARQLAHEYAVSGFKPTEKVNRFVSDSPAALLAFSQEIGKLMDRASIGKEKALPMLWMQATYSILDFLNEDGVVLSIKELKKLPPEMRSLIEYIDVQSWQEPLKDDKGQQVMKDGVPMVTIRNSVKLRMPDKQEALRQIAQIMRWVGPLVAVNNNNYFNIATLMQRADARAARTGQLYEGEKAKQDG